MPMPTLLGLNVGGTTCSAALGDGTGHIHQRIAWPSEAHAGPERMIDAFISRTHELIDHAGVWPQAVGVAIGGPLDAEHGMILSPPNLPGWDRIPLTQLLEKALSLPVRVEHDAAACALAEHLWGAGQNCRYLAYLTCGTGFGVGLVLDGKPHYGVGGTAPELGHVQYRDSGPTAFGKQGCFEAFASATSLTRLAQWRYPERWGGQPPSPEQLGQLANDGDHDATSIIRLNADAVGDAAALLVDLLAVQKVILGSLARYLGEPWIEQVRRRFESQIGPWLVGKCEIQPAMLEDRLQDCSALAAARSVQI